MPKTHPAVQVLQRAAEGLWFPSETDAPFTPFFWPRAGDEQLSAEVFRQLAGAPQDAPIETVELDHFFRNVAEAQEWHDVIQAAQVEKGGRLVRTIKATLENVQVLRVGEISIDVYIVGQVEGGYAGLRTLVVET